MMRGEIVLWLHPLGYGFIRPDGASPHAKDIYFHVTVVEGGDASIYRYAPVEFELNPHGGTRPSATLVRVLTTRSEKAQTTSAPMPKPAAPKPATVQKTSAPAPAPKPIEAAQLPPAVAKALGLIDEPEQRKTKRERLNSAHGR